MRVTVSLWLDVHQLLNQITNLTHLNTSTKKKTVFRDCLNPTCGPRNLNAFRDIPHQL